MRQATTCSPLRTLLLCILLPGLLCCLPFFALQAHAASVSMLQSVEAALACNPELKASQEKRQVAVHAIGIGEAPITI